MTMMDAANTTDTTATAGATRIADIPNAAASRIVGRLAPSPTGRLHMGNVYAALAAWLSARSRGGTVLLRIEDIDGPRAVPGADEAIMNDYRWLGLDWDGDPVWQSRSPRLYDAALETLRRKGLVYPCFCSRADLRAASAPHDDDGFLIYPGTCARLDDAERRRRIERGDRHSWRLVMPDVDITVRDRIFGPRTYNLARDCGDIVVRRSDGIIAYQLAVTVDDVAQGVTDIVRGRDLLRSAAIQMWLRRCLWGGDAETLRSEGSAATHHDGAVGDGAIVDTAPHGVAQQDAASADSLGPDPLHPSFAHVPLLDDGAGRRLAKRTKAVDIGALREAGASAEGIVGECAWLLGLQSAPAPARPADLVDAWSDAAVRADLRDRRLDAAALAALTAA